MLKLSTVIFIYAAALFNCYATEHYVSKQGSEYVNSLAAYVSDVDGDTLFFSKVSGPNWLTVATDGSLSGTPQFEDIGDNNFIVKVTDSKGAFSTTTLLIAVDAAPVIIEVPDEAVNQAPTFSSDNFSLEYATEDQAFTASIASMASDAENDLLSFSKTSGPTWLTVASNGAISGTPKASDVGVQIFTVKVVADGGEDSTTINLTVKAKAVQEAEPTGTSSGGALYQLCLLLLVMGLYRRQASSLFLKSLFSDGRFLDGNYVKEVRSKQIESV